jgi:hypothetical protein
MTDFYGSPNEVTNRAPKYVLSEAAKARMPMADLEKTQEFQQLTRKQQLFVRTYCEGGLSTGNYDAVEATRTAYACKTPEIARIMSYSQLQNIRIIAVLSRHFCRTPIEDFMTLLDRAIANKHLTTAQMDALRLKFEILGYPNRLPTLHALVGTVPQDILDAGRAARKPKRKQRKPNKPAEKSELQKAMGRF